MTLRKHGTRTGEVIGVEPQEGGIQVVASSHVWPTGADHELDAENTEADLGDAPAQDG